MILECDVSTSGQLKAVLHEALFYFTTVGILKNRLLCTLCGMQRGGFERYGTILICEFLVEKLFLLSEKANFL